MSIVQYNPWGNPRGLQDEIKQVFDRFLGEADTDPSSVVTSQWTPRVDIREDADRFVILADIPGVDPKDIEVHMDKGILTLRGERVSEKKDEGSRHSRVERVHGTFYRRFALPDSANPDGITASGKHGVLRIDIPKKPETTPRRIQVQ
ncbi:Hsp20/alpha crystallin family protein [Pseudoxanthomonas putridarboris]|uniref:Hsp20/alpha crystallin family protein n=1 Tax=Pseudoxanthomonas putridarboris TaxID=752605 RepID=A0ABU9J4M7_9GAMM